MTLFILDNKEINRYPLFWLAISIFCILFSTIYHLFSHGVTSAYMQYMFLIPLLFGVLGSYALHYLIHESPSRFYQDGVVVITIWSCLNGILEIYGTTSNLTIYFLIAGLTLIFIGLSQVIGSSITKGSNSQKM